MNNKTKKKIFSKKFWDRATTILLVLTGGVLSILGGLLAQQCAYNNTLELQRTNLRESSYTQLSGLRVTLRQQYVTRFEALTYFYYHEYKYYHFGNNDIDSEQMQRFLIRSEDYVDIITETWQKIYNALAEIKVSFDVTPEIDKLITTIINYENPIIKNPNEGEVQINSPEDLENWKKQTVIEIQNYSILQYDLPIQQLLAELEKQLITDQLE